MPRSLYIKKLVYCPIYDEEINIQECGICEHFKGTIDINEGEFITCDYEEDIQ